MSKKRRTFRASQRLASVLRIATMSLTAVSIRALAKGSTAVVLAAVHLLILEAAPEPLYEGVVKRTATTIHGYTNAMPLELFSPHGRSKLATLIGIKNLGRLLRYDQVAAYSVLDSSQESTLRFGLW